MSSSSSGSGSDTTIDPQDSTQTSILHCGSSKRKSVIDTRRAEQNRAAQRAFRQRKALHVKELENKVRDMEILKDRLERLELENNRLKHRLWELESSPKPTTNNSNSLPPLTNSSPPSRPYGDHKTVNHDDTPPLHYHDLNSINKTTGTAKIRPSQPLESIHPLLHSPPATYPILPPPSPSPSLFRPIPVSYWEKRPPSDEQYYQHHSEQGQALDDLATILRTRHRPSIEQPPQNEPMHT